MSRGLLCHRGGCGEFGRRVIESNFFCIFLETEPGEMKEGLQRFAPIDVPVIEQVVGCLRVLLTKGKPEESIGGLYVEAVQAGSDDRDADAVLYGFKNRA